MDGSDWSRGVRRPTADAGPTADDTRRRLVGDARAIVRNDERVLLVFLVLLFVVALVVFLHFTVSVLDGLPAVPPPTDGGR